MSKLERIITAEPFGKNSVRVSMAVKNSAGAMEFWFWVGSDQWGESGIYGGGVETHSAVPFKYSSDKETPDHSDCRLIGRCWHDGTSLYAREYVIPLFQEKGADAVWSLLESRHSEEFPIVPEDQP